MLEAKRRGADQELIDELVDKILRFQTPLEKEVEDAEDLMNLLPVYHHVSGYSHPLKVVFSSLQPFQAEVAEWGLTAPWVKTKKEAYDFKKPANNCLNAQAAGMFEKSTFKYAAKYGRCVVSIDSYYEHHKANGKTYPFRIFKKDGSPLYIAAISSRTKYVDEATGEEITKTTVATLTTSANVTLARIHNEPATLATSGHRMLVILDEEQIGPFLEPYPYTPGENGDPQVEKDFQEKILSLCVPYDERKLGYYSVRNLRQRKDMPYVGNTPEIKEEFKWPDLDYSEIEG